MNLVKYAHFLDTIGRSSEADTLIFIVHTLGAKEAIRVTEELIAEGELPAMPEELIKN